MIVSVTFVEVWSCDQNNHQKKCPKISPDLALLAELDQQLNWLHGIAPLVVSAGVVAGGDAAGGPVPAVEPVLQVDLGLANQVVRTEQVPVQHLHRQHRVLREGSLELEAPGVGTSGI